MSIGTVPVVAAANSRIAMLRERWAQASPALQLRVRLGILVIATVAAYHYSLESLSQTLGFDTPLAYVGLVPFIAILLAFAKARPSKPEPAIQDRQLDYIIGVPLIVVALAMNEFLPRQQSVLYWVRREDLLSLPLFVGGAVAILFGTRVLWRQKVPICYLLLAWPWPYTTILLGTLNGFTNVTVWALTRALSVVHFAQPAGGTSGSGLFSITHHGHAFLVSVISACSGVDGMVGFLLVGTALASIVRGPRLRVGIWLAVGLAVLWTTNLFRLLLIFWAGQEWGEHVAIGILHPVVGLLIFNIGIVVMLLLLRPFGLRFRFGSSPPPVPAAVAAVGAPRARPRILFAATIVVVVGALLAFNNSSLRAFDLVASADGEPRLSAFIANPATPHGWSAQFTTEYFSNKSLFGESSRWFRYTYFYRGPGGDLSSTLPVTADVINAKGVTSFGAYGVTACYNFHGYTMRDITDVALGDGIRGQALSFASGTDEDWSVVYWIWPVKLGNQDRYERVILYLNNTTTGAVHIAGEAPKVSGIKNALNPANAVDERLIQNRAFLVKFAQEIVAGQRNAPPESVLISQVTPPVSLVPGPGSPVIEAAATKSAQKRARILALIHDQVQKTEALAHAKTRR